MSRWKWIRHDGTVLRDVGVDSDGSLFNPRGYPADVVRAAVAGAEARLRERRGAAARQAAATRRRRKEKLVYQTAQRIIVGDGAPGPAKACVICGRGLDDPDSISRGIGSECWQGVLAWIEASRRSEPDPQDAHGSDGEHLGSTLGERNDHDDEDAAYKAWSLSAGVLSCTICRHPLDPQSIAGGYDTHPGC